MSTLLEGEGGILCVLSSSTARIVFASTLLSNVSAMLLAESGWLGGWRTGGRTVFGNRDE